MIRRHVGIGTPTIGTARWCPADHRNCPMSSFFFDQTQRGTMLCAYQHHGFGGFASMPQGADLDGQSFF
jgi:hypothetical protein